MTVPMKETVQNTVGGRSCRSSSRPSTFLSWCVIQVAIIGGVIKVVSAVQNQGQCGSCWTLSAPQAVDRSWCRFWVDTAWISLLSGSHAHFFCETARSCVSSWRHLWCRGGQCCQESGSLWILSGVLFLAAVSQLVLTSGGFRVDLAAKRVHGIHWHVRFLWLRGGSSSRVSGCQRISCSLFRDTGFPRISGGDLGCH